jgi:hypothetical protein
VPRTPKGDGSSADRAEGWHRVSQRLVAGAGGGPERALVNSRELFYGLWSMRLIACTAA